MQAPNNHEKKDKPDAPEISAKDPVSMLMSWYSKLLRIKLTLIYCVVDADVHERTHHAEDGTWIGDQGTLGCAQISGKICTQ